MRLRKSTKKILMGAFSFVLLSVSALCISHLSKAEEQGILAVHYEDISTYRGDNAKIPSMSDYVFAGWYNTYDESTKEFSEPLSKDTVTDENGAWAKFVPNYVLNIKAQVSSNVLSGDISTENPAAIRLVTSVDSLQYDTVGFVITRSDKEDYRKETSAKTVSKTLYYVGQQGGASMPITPQEIFGECATYFRAFTFTNMPETAVDTEIIVTPYWITLDGTRVEGTQGVKTLNKGRSWVFVNTKANSDGKQYGTKEHPYTNISIASADVLDDQEGRVFLQSDMELTSQIEIGDVNVTIQDDGTKRTISRSSAWADDVAMFKLGSKSQLSFASTGTDELPMLVVDGNKENITVGASTRLVSIPTATTVSVGAGVQVSHFKATSSATNGEIGGAISVNGGTLKITGGIFDGNEGARGGAINISAANSIVNITGGTFLNNVATAVHGGAINVLKACTEFKVEGATFIGNKATNQGGAIYFDNSTMDASIENCTFTSNTSQYGGAIVNNIQKKAEDKKVTLTGNTFTGNAGTKGGGALSTGKNTVTVLNNNTFSDNTGASQGADVRVGDENSQVKLSGINNIEVWLTKTAYLTLATDFDTSSRMDVLCADSRVTAINALVTCEDPTKATDSLNSLVLKGSNLTDYTLGVTEAGDLILKKLIYPIAGYNYKDSNIFALENWKGNIPTAE